MRVPLTSFAAITLVQPWMTAIASTSSCVSLHSVLSTAALVILLKCKSTNAPQLNVYTGLHGFAPPGISLPSLFAEALISY